MIFPGGEEYKRHESMRGYLAYELYLQMAINKDIWLIVGDLGYKVWDQHFKDFPDRCINTGAAEQAMMGIAVGLALEGKKPFVYSITSFLIKRAFETISLYLEHESIPVRLVGSGRDKDYAHDGFSHDCTDIASLFDREHGFFKNIIDIWPQTKEEIPAIVQDMVNIDDPWLISLRR